MQETPSAYVTAYRQGYADAVNETLDQLENKSKIEPAGGYTGPVPPELTAWIEHVRRTVKGIG